MSHSEAQERQTLTAEFLFNCENGNLAQVTKIAARLNDINLANSAGRTGLMSAASRNRIDVIAFLLEKGADPNQANANGTTPLMFAKTAAFSYGDTTGMKMLIDAGADRNARDKHGLTALEYTKMRAALIRDFLENY